MRGKDIIQKIMKHMKSLVVIPAEAGIELASLLEY